jgi:hypothetical protein
MRGVEHSTIRATARRFGREAVAVVGRSDAHEVAPAFLIGRMPFTIRGVRQRET